MAVLTRKDGEETRARILDAACRVFAERGYMKATHAVIAQEAGVNAALINFHFRSKDNLYLEVWNRLVELLDAQYPLEVLSDETLTPEQRLHETIRRSVNMGAKPESEMFHRLHLREMLAPTGILDERIGGRIKVMQKNTRQMVQELLGEKATPEDVTAASMLVSRVCHILRPPPVKHERKRIAEWERCMKNVDEVVESTYAFCLAGLEQLRKRINARETTVAK